MNRRVYIFALLWVFLFASELCAATYWVAKTGGGSTCSQASPCLTIAVGIGKLSTGDTLNIRTGTYNEQIQAPANLSNVAITAYNNEVVTVDGTGYSNALNFTFNNANSNWTFTGINFTRGHDVIYTGNASNITLQGTASQYARIYNGDCMGLQGEGVNWHVIYVESDNNGSRCTDQPDHANYVGYGVYWRGTGSILEHMNIHDNHGYGIQQWGSGYDNNTYRYNRIHDNSGPECCWGVIIGSGDNNIFHDNLIYDTGYGLELSHGCTNCKVYSNTIFRNTTYVGIHIDAGSTNAIVRNNIVWDNNGDIVDLSGNATQDHNLCNSGCGITGDPQFVSTTPSDPQFLRLLAGSPAIDAGVNLGSSYNTDYTGNARGVGGAWDIGAYEYGGNTYWVSKSSNGDGQCISSANPLTGTAELTIAGGIACMSAGDTLYIRAGTYAESITDAGLSSGSVNQPFTVAGYTGETITIQGLRFDSNPGLSYWTFDNLHIVEPDPNSSRDLVYFMAGDSHITIKNSVISGASREGLAGGADNSLFQNVEIYNSGRLGDPHSCYGIYQSGHDNIFEGMNVHDNPGYGHHMYNSGHTDVSNNIIRNSRYYNNGGSESGQGGILIGTGSNNVVYNTLVYGNGFGRANNASGIIVQSGCSGCALYGNSIYNNSNFGIYLDGPDLTTVQNNISWSNGLAPIQNSGTNTTSDHNLTTDPSFVNAANGDFTLQSNSPAKDAGTPLGSPYDTDYAGVTRPQGSGWDIGAYEYFGGEIPPPLLVAAYSFSEGSGLPQDSSGKGNNANAMTGATWVTGSNCKYGGCLLFDGTGGVTVPASSSLALTTFTLEAWVKPTVTPPTAFKSIINHNTTGGGYYFLFASSGDTNMCAGYQPTGGWSGVSDQHVCDTSTIAQNTLAHLAVTYDGTDIRFYRDGSLTNTTTAGAATSPTQQTFYIGFSEFGENFTGYIDEVRIYNYARTLSEIQSDKDTPLGTQIYLRVGDKGISIGDKVLRIGQQ